MHGAELLYTQCQRALKAPKVGCVIERAGMPFQGLGQMYMMPIPGSAQPHYIGDFLVAFPLMHPASCQS